MYNKVVNRFLIYNEIKPDKLSEKIDTSVHKTPEYLGLFCSTAVYNPPTITNVSIGDIYGCDSHIVTNNDDVFQLLNIFYKDDSDDKKAHNNRSNDNLSMGMNQMIEKTNSSPELMTVCRVDNENNINLIYTNGMHRFLALRALYLNLAGNYPNRTEEWKKRFTVRAYLYTLSEVKTFCAHIIRRYYREKGKNILFEPDYKEREYTGKMIIIVREGTNIVEQYVLNDNELIEFTKPLLDEQIDYYRDVDVEMFKKFMNSIGFGFNPNLNR